MENGTYEIKNSSNSGVYLNGLRVIHMTQDNDYVYIILSRKYTTSTAMSSMGLASIKLNKSNLTTTSAEGPTAIPFTIQGETVSNIGIDVIV